MEDPYSLYAKRRWLREVWGLRKEHIWNLATWYEMIEQAVDSVFASLSTPSFSLPPLTDGMLAVLAVVDMHYRRGQKKVAAGLWTCFIHVRRDLKKHRCTYVDAASVCESVDWPLARMPQFLRKLSEQQCSEDAVAVHLPVISPPVMCYLCGEGFLSKASLEHHTNEKHAGWAEYRKRLFWEAESRGFEAMLPWVKRWILSRFSFFQCYAVPGEPSQDWQKDDSISRAVPRREEACVVCARRDWIDQRFPVYMSLVSSVS